MDLKNVMQPDTVYLKQLYNRIETEIPKAKRLVKDNKILSIQYNAAEITVSQLCRKVGTHVVYDNEILVTIKQSGDTFVKTLPKNKQTIKDIPNIIKEYTVTYNENFEKVRNAFAQNKKIQLKHRKLSVDILYNDKRVAVIKLSDYSVMYCNFEMKLSDVKKLRSVYCSIQLCMARLQ